MLLLLVLLTATESKGGAQTLRRFALLLAGLCSPAGSADGTGLVPS